MTILAEMGAIVMGLRSDPPVGGPLQAGRMAPLWGSPMLVGCTK